MIEVSGLSKTYILDGVTVKAVDNIGMTVEKGDFVAIAGHSGSGKTTLLSLIGGLTRPDKGSLILDGMDLCFMDDEALSSLRNKKIGFVFQFASLVPTLTAVENVQLPAVFGEYDERTGERALALLSRVGLKDKATAYPSQLSGGQQRRVAIARAFMNSPELVLADEPTGDLDEETEKEIMEFFKEMNRTFGVTFIIVTHSTEIARQAKKQFRMSGGVLSKPD